MGRFIPGGRYVLMMKTDFTTLKLWDVGLPGGRLKRPELVAKVELKKEETARWETSVFGERIRIVIGTSRW